jgi:glutaminyl-peptide cyclotransferase
VRSAGFGDQGKLPASKRKPKLRSVTGAVWFLSLLLIVLSCKPSDTAVPVDSQNSQVDPNKASASVPNGTPWRRRERIWIDFDGRQAFAEAKTLSDFGPRPSGSDANKQLRQHLVDRLTRLGWQTSEQRLTEQAPDGREIEFCNIVARFSPYQVSPQPVLIGAHFDTPSTQEFQDPGASDGAANTAVLMELARTLALDPQLAGSVELLFLDGHSPFRELTLNDGLFGSRFSAQMLSTSHHAGDFRAAILLDHIGGVSLNYLPNSDPNLASALKKAATVLGVKLEPANRSLLADHIPFAQAGIPSIALLDAEFPFLDTADDTVDRLDANSLAKTGKLILYFIAAERTTQ